MRIFYIRPRYAQGFTIINLMITFIILAILLCIAYPSYQNHIRKTRLYQAQSAILRNSQALDRHYQSKLSYKINSTTWMTLPIQETEHFCLRLVGNPRGAADGHYSLKAVAYDVNHEPRVLKFDQNGITLICKSSDSRCSESTPYFRSGSSVDKECTLFNS